MSGIDARADGSAAAIYTSLFRPNLSVETKWRRSSESYMSEAVNRGIGEGGMRQFFFDCRQRDVPRFPPWKSGLGRGTGAAARHTPLKRGVNGSGQNIVLR
jgi:hypothetical protein